MNFDGLPAVEELGERRDVQEVARQDEEVRASTVRHSIALKPDLRSLSGQQHTFIAQVCVRVCCSGVCHTLGVRVHGSGVCTGVCPTACAMVDRMSCQVA